MKKSLIGIVVAQKMIHTAIVEVVRKTPHPMYRKLIKRSKKYKVDMKDMPVVVGNTVEIVETHPISKDKHFKIEKILQKIKEQK